MSTEADKFTNLMESIDRIKEIEESDDPFCLNDVEPVSEEVVEGGFSLEVEADMESNDDLVTIIQSGHPVASMSGDEFKQLVREYKRTQHRP